MAETLTLGERIRKARERRGISLYQLSRETGVNRWALKMIEDGKTDPLKLRVDTAKRLIGKLFPDIDLIHFGSER